MHGRKFDINIKLIDSQYVFDSAGGTVKRCALTMYLKVALSHMVCAQTSGSVGCRLTDEG